MKKPKKTANDWLDDIIGSSQLGRVDEVPEGWMTMPQMAAAKGVAETTMYNRVNRAIRVGLVQRKQFRVCVGRHITDVWHYYKK